MVVNTIHLKAVIDTAVMLILVNRKNLGVTMQNMRLLELRV